jgi:hypothetical protein
MAALARASRVSSWLQPDSWQSAKIVGGKPRRAAICPADGMVALNDPWVNELLPRTDTNGIEFD